MNSFQNHLLLKDKEVANIFSMSHSWVRKQRHLRRKQQSHFLTIDPVMVGSSPRYRKDDVAAIFNGMKGGVQ